MRDRDNGTAILDATITPEQWVRLRECLARLYDAPDKARRVTADAGLNVSTINFNGAAREYWHSVLDEATKRGMLSAIFKIARNDYATDSTLLDIERRLSEPGCADSASGMKGGLGGLYASPSKGSDSAGSHAVAGGVTEFRATPPTPLRCAELSIRPVVRFGSRPEAGFSRRLNAPATALPAARSTGTRFRRNRYFHLVVFVICVVGILLWIVGVGGGTDQSGGSGLRGMIVAVARSSVARFERRPACPEGMILIPAGDFQMGALDGQGEIDEHPRHRVRFFRPYCLERTEVSIASYQGCVAAGVCSEPDSFNPAREHGSRFCNWMRAGAGSHPVNCVDWWQASRFCRWAGHVGGSRRLPTEAEWEFAARSTEERLYPWGNELPSNARGNLCGSECPPVGVATIARWRDGYASTAPVDEFLAGATPSGALNLAGNVAEWVQDRYRVDAYSRHDGSGFPLRELSDPSEDASLRATRGGDWQLGVPTAIRATRRSFAVPGARAATLGFRCARDVP